LQDFFAATWQALIFATLFFKTVRAFKGFNGQRLHVSTSEYLPWKFRTTRAEVAQLVERNLAKVEVAGSNLVFRSTKNFLPCGGFFLGQRNTGLYS
jgi:hypothetical protein